MEQVMTEQALLNTLRLDNQVAIVTGGTNGIGKAIALALARQGAKVLAVGTNEERGKAVCEEAKAETQKESVIFFKADVSDKAQVEKLMSECLERFEKVDILVNCAGITRDGLLMKMSEEDWDKVLDVNLKSCFHTCQAVIRPMLKAKSGKIINITSVVGLIGNPGQTNYAASKAGLIGFSKALAKEVASRNIAVNCVAPGFIETHMTDFLQGEKKDKLLETIPMKRMGKAEEIANLVLFLASPLASYMTGQVFTIDGGIAM